MWASGGDILVLIGLANCRHVTRGTAMRSSTLRQEPRSGLYLLCYIYYLGGKNTYSNHAARASSEMTPPSTDRTDLEVFGSLQPVGPSGSKVKVGAGRFSCTTENLRSKLNPSSEVRVAAPVNK